MYFMAMVNVLTNFVFKGLHLALFLLHDLVTFMLSAFCPWGGHFWYGFTEQTQVYDYVICYLFTFLSFYDLSPPGEDGDGNGVADETQDPYQVEKNSWSCCCFVARLTTTGYMQLWKIRNVMSKGQNLQLAIKSWMLVLQERCNLPGSQNSKKVS